MRSSMRIFLIVAVFIAIIDVSEVAAEKTCRAYFKKYDAAAIDESGAARCDFKQERLSATKATKGARDYARCVCLFETQLWSKYNEPLWRTYP
jgi:hypothetical protein